jgi:hypothetical protein
VTSACFEGTGSGFTGICCGGGPGGGAAPVLSYFSPPGTANVRQIMSAVIVVASDSLGSVNEAFSGVVTVALATNPTGASLSGTTAVRASDGLATFGDLSIDRAGTYTLRASASGSSVTSSPFTITPATP